MKVIYWRRELPPLSEQIAGEHEVEAESPRVPYAYDGRQAMWSACYGPLLEEAERRIGQEVQRLDGSCAHVVDEVVTAKIDDAAGTFRLHGRFRYVLYRHVG